MQGRVGVRCPLLTPYLDRGRLPLQTTLSRWPAYSGIPPLYLPLRAGVARLTLVGHEGGGGPVNAYA